MENLQAFSARSPRNFLFTIGTGPDQKKRRDSRCGNEAGGGQMDGGGQASGGGITPPPHQI